MALSDGFYPGLAVFEADNDYFAVTVPTGGTLDASIVFANANGDMDLYLWDPLVACDTNVAGQGTGAGALAVASRLGRRDDHLHNTTGAAQNLILEVDMFDAGGCNSYDLIATGIGGTAGPIGSNYWCGEPELHGQRGCVSGSAYLRRGERRHPDGVEPSPGQSHLRHQRLLHPEPRGQQRQPLPHRQSRPLRQPQILFIDGTGEASLAIDLTAIPSGAGTIAAVAGDTRYFQDGTRGVGGGSNFTEGLQISFTN